MASSPPAEPTRRQAGCLLLFALPFVVGGIAVLVHGVREVARGAASRSWPTAAARVVSARLGEHDGSESTTYSADVTYDFVADGTHRTGSRVRFGAWSGSEASARAVLARYPVGAEVEARYRPDDPDDAVLEPGAGGGAYAIVAFGALFALLGGGIPIGMLITARRLGRPLAWSR